MNYLFLFTITFFFSLLFTFVAKKIANKMKIVDKPSKERKIHKKQIPLLGGFGVFFSFFLVLFFAKNDIISGDLNVAHWAGVFGGALILMIGGFLDDKYELKPKYSFIFPVLAALFVIAGGVEIEKISSPTGGYIYFDVLKIPILKIGDTWRYFVVFSDILIFAWLLGMMYTTKLLDGIDGLVAGLTAIGAFIIFLFTTSEQYYQGDIAVASIILCAACLGFLILNWNPASIFLGEGGSLLLGFILGVLAIISGGKIAIALLVMGIPIMDAAWTILRRIKAGKNPFKFADRKHLHHRILELGIGQKKTVLFYYSVASLFGLSALFFQSKGKLLALFALLFLMLFVVAFFNYLDKKNAS